MVFSSCFSEDLKFYKVHFPNIFYKIYKRITCGYFLTGEATPNYIIYPGALERIKKILPNVKLIVLMRNPIDRTFSAYRRYKRQGKEKRPFKDVIIYEINKIVKAQKEGKEIYYTDIYDKESRRDDSCVLDSIYFLPLKRLFSIFGKNQVFLLKSEDLFTNPERIYQEILTFLEIPYFPFKEFKVYNKGQKEVMDRDSYRLLYDFFKPYNHQLVKLVGNKFYWF